MKKKGDEQKTRMRCRFSEGVARSKPLVRWIAFDSSPLLEKKCVLYRGWAMDGNGCHAISWKQKVAQRAEPRNRILVHT